MKDILSMNFLKKQPSTSPTPLVMEHDHPSTTPVNVHADDDSQRDIALRRRLSTPRASPLPKHGAQGSRIVKNDPVSMTPKTNWFKSLERQPKVKIKILPLKCSREIE